MQFDFSMVKDLQELRWYALFLTDIPSSPGLNLFHYTSEEAREKIVQDKCIDFRLRRADHFPDNQEGKHIIPVFEEACRRCYNAGEIDLSFYNTLLSFVPAFDPICERLRHLYVLCFSKDDNNQHLIENYACKNGTRGVSIGIQNLALEKIEAELFKTYHISGAIIQQDVLYNPEQTIQSLQKILRQVYLLSGQDNTEYSISRSIVIEQLSIYCLAYKDKSFEPEKETRIIIDPDRFPSETEYINKDLEDPEQYIHLKLDLDALYHVEEVTPHDQL